MRSEATLEYLKVIMIHQISNRTLTIEKVNEIITKGYKLELSKEAEAAIVKCRQFLDSKMGDIGRPVYGITTGFGSLCNITIPAEDLSQLQHNLVMSHACGTGETVRQGSVFVIWTFRCSADYSAATDRYVQQRHPACGVSAGFSRSIR